MKHIPNLFTLLNLFFGCMAIVFALQTEAVNLYRDDNLVTSFNMPERITYAAIFIGIAGIIDFLDGFIARLFRAESAMGKQLDSLSDIVSFGVAPAVILYQFLRMSFMRQENGLDVPVGWFFPAFIFACAGAYRLARFNLDNVQAFGFKGIPIPAAGMVVASLPLIAHYNYFNGTVNDLLFNKWFLYGLICILSYLMVSTVPLLAFKFKDRSIKANIPVLVLLITSLIAAFLIGWLAVPLVFVCYIALSLTLKNPGI